MNRWVIAPLAMVIVLSCQNVRGQETAAPKKESTATLAETLSWLQRNFQTGFTYDYSTLATSGDTPVANRYSVTVSRVPLRFEDCDLSWRDGDDVVWISLKDFDPESPVVRLHTKENAKFDSDVWELSMLSRGRKEVVTVQLGGGTKSQLRPDLVLLYDNKSDANKFARVFQHAIRLCQ